MKKNRAKTKSSWLCFRADSIDSEKFKSESIDRRLSDIATAKHEDEAMVSLENNVSNSKICSENGNSDRIRSKSKRLSKIAKAVFFETTLIKSGKVQQDPYLTLRNLPTKSEKISHVKSSRKGSKEDDSFRYSSSISSSSCSSSSSSLSSSLNLLTDRKKSFGSNSFERKQSKNQSDNSKQMKNPSEQSKMRKIKITDFSSTHGLFLLLISLMVLIFWGRLCAIICTLTWIYFAPTRQKNEEEEGEVLIKKAVEEQEIESREYKKKVIMEGLLERSHSRF